ncbi:RagB/SusD family nutrient uptake outer membrane protein [Chitinophaga horti]|uniref:RagB/SusD family nutrient uptake outer membrane protein n=1 Tax=Chitinophaga horti TaxID=2920382 RepID=A0ABY6J228_9BACT|nr:RagB/SusD family nutrient uptake outer membrane protein [Chitinophaga horti]UYQ92207.1 RagB/SusD family nutrient uptake outer membrane protein [Chitinophaga horti]
MKKIHIVLACVFSCIMLTGCGKDFLEEKPSSEIVQPRTLDEFQKLLDNNSAINATSGLGILGGDEYEFSNNDTWKAAPTVSRNSYIWAADLFEGENSDNWNLPYTAIFYANNVLAGLQTIVTTPQSELNWKYTNGWALFVRAYAYFDLVSNFSKSYSKSTAASDLGIPLRVKPSIDEVLPRSSVEQTYSQIINDLNAAIPSLNVEVAATKTRPSKYAAYALLAKVYLTMEHYKLAELYADSCLQLNNRLLNYNSLSKTSNAPFALNHGEQIYHSQAVGNGTYSTSSNNANIKVSPELIALYGPNDLRLNIFFLRQSDGTYDFKRGYGGPGLVPFTGLAMDEVYLIKAESAARNGNISTAMSYLNQLLINRWNPGATNPAAPYIDMSAQTRDEALNMILLERRKELVWRGARWQDVKRLNSAGGIMSLKRIIDGKTYILDANDPKFVFPIPDNEIVLSKINQNIR